MLPLPLTYKNPCHCWLTRVCCYTLTKPDYLAPLQNSTPMHCSSQWEWTSAIASVHFFLRTAMHSQFCITDIPRYRRDPKRTSSSKVWQEVLPQTIFCWLWYLRICKRTHRIWRASADASEQSQILYVLCCGRKPSCFYDRNNAKPRTSAVRRAWQETTSRYLFGLEHFFPNLV